jgi:hypothetical protein
MRGQDPLLVSILPAHIRMPDLYDVRGVNDDIRINIGRVHPLACTVYETLRGIKNTCAKVLFIFMKRRWFVTFYREEKTVVIGMYLR